MFLLHKVPIAIGKLEGCVCRSCFICKSRMLYGFLRNLALLFTKRFCSTSFWVRFRLIQAKFYFT